MASFDDEIGDINPAPHPAGSDPVDSPLGYSRPSCERSFRLIDGGQVSSKVHLRQSRHIRLFRQAEYDGRLMLVRNGYPPGMGKPSLAQGPTSFIAALEAVRKHIEKIGNTIERGQAALARKTEEGTGEKVSQKSVNTFGRGAADLGSRKLMSILDVTPEVAEVFLNAVAGAYETEAEAATWSRVSKRLARLIPPTAALALLDAVEDAHSIDMLDLTWKAMRQETQHEKNAIAKDRARTADQEKNNIKPNTA